MLYYFSHFPCVFGSKIVPYGINEYDYNAILQGPSMKHLFGTDEFGRDLFSRIVLMEPDFTCSRIQRCYGQCSLWYPFSDFWPDITADGLILLLRESAMSCSFSGLILYNRHRGNPRKLA